MAGALFHTMTAVIFVFLFSFLFKSAKGVYQDITGESTNSLMDMIQLFTSGDIKCTYNKNGHGREIQMMNFGHSNNNGYNNNGYNNINGYNY